MNKRNEIEFIKGISNIRITELCKEEKVSTSNLYTLKVPLETLHNIKLNIDNKIKKVYEDYERNNTL